jgi:hypothetical protein
MGLAGQLTPAVVATWPIPNYVDPITRGPELYIINSIWLLIATFAVALRLYSRIWIRNWFGLDDIFVLVALVCNFIYLNTSWSIFVMKSGTLFVQFQGEKARQKSM